MKKVNSLLSMLALAGMVVFSGCSKDDEDPAPATSSCSIKKTYNLTVGSATGADVVTDNISVTNSTGCVNMTFEVSSTENLQKFKILLVKDGGVSNALQVSGFDYNSDTKLHTVPNKTNNLFTVSFDLPVETNSSRVTDQYSIIFYTDNAGNDEAASGTITLTYGVTNTFKTIAATTLAAGDFYDVEGETKYTSANVAGNESKIDLVYGNGVAAGNEFFIGGPSDASVSSLYTSSWSTKNATLVKSTTLTDWSAIDTDAEINSAFTDGTNDADGTRFNEATAGNFNGKIIAFQTAGGKKGVAKISNASTGSVTVDIKYVP